MNIKLSTFVALFLLCSLGFVQARDQDTTEAAVNDTINQADFPFYGQNENCLRCHGNQNYVFSDSVSGSEQRRIMCVNYIVRREEFYRANHKSFACTDCHSEEFMTFPHKIETRMEEIYNCIDCHAGDEAYAQYHFEQIQAEYDSSTHAQIPDFTCWKCHDPHSYKITARTSNNIVSTIRYDNNICLSCHANFQNFSLLTDREEIDLLENHEWLPNQVAHFASVRCIECHTMISDTMLIAHKVLPKEMAVRKCTECHSSDSRLMSTLYKFQRQQERKTGFLNSIIINDSYVIAANRNLYLTIAGFIILGIVVLAIVLHVSMRISKSKREQNG